jgi:hypothetical protein
MTVVYWKKPVSGSFETASDWSTGTVPDGDEVFINAVGHYTVTSLAHTVSSLSVGAGVTLDVNESGWLFSVDMIGASSGALSSTNAGTIEATNGSGIGFALNGENGPVSFTNTGLLEAIGTDSYITIGDSEVSTPFVNDGQLVANGGEIFIGGSVTGDGRATIEHGGTLFIGNGNFSDPISFASNAKGTLEVLFDVTPPPGFPSGAQPDGSPTVSGIVSGFAAGDTIQLPFGAGTTLSYTPDAADNGGTLTVTDGDRSGTITLAGYYDPIGFHFANGAVTYSTPPTLADFYNASWATYEDNPQNANGLLGGFLALVFGGTLGHETNSTSNNPPPGMTLLASSTNAWVQGNTNWLSDGFFAQAFKENGNVIIAFEGTDLTTLPSYSPGTVKADLDILLGGDPQAFGDADSFVSDVLAHFNLNANSIYLTGHSLGGAEAEYVASTILPNASGVTFAAPGLPDLTSPVPASNFINYVEYSDPFGNFGHHLGTVVGIPPGSPQNESLLTAEVIAEAAATDGASLIGVFENHLLPSYASNLNLHLNQSGYAA